MGSGDMEGLGLEEGLVRILIMLMKRFWTCGDASFACG